MRAVAGRPAVPRIGFVNLMPRAEQFETMLLPQFALAAPMEPVWLKVNERRYALDDRASIDRRYRPLAAALAEGPLDGLVVTGAAVEHLPFHEVRFLPELSEIVGYAAMRGIPVLGLCWGALAVGHLLLDMSHTVWEDKVSGVFETELLVRDHPLATGLDDRFWTAHSRYAGFDESCVDRLAAAGRVRVIARSAGAGTVIAESADHKVLMHIGHPEYAAGRLAEEYRRDVDLGLPNVRPPAGVELDRPVNRWRSHSMVFFANWVRLVCQPAAVPAAARGAS
ncbi:MAG TPA: homoserine O-succinyltransferase [Actinophytocola sp.]|uniref:homoserine O-acetyltransferase/O-succinyltransferase family protein n=1 Tax=Actinophytocola sp. TaxID=1872138 RepID=UPI002DBA1760|nr:homoserine O-succinyltransferase [Actinophytocola sp.]HEU5469673.1 homoserine O-succinyltransferase [Actinophytocola sp.]